MEFYAMKKCKLDILMNDIYTFVKDAAEDKYYRSIEQNKLLNIGIKKIETDMIHEIVESVSSFDEKETVTQLNDLERFIEILENENLSLFKSISKKLLKYAKKLKFIKNKKDYWTAIKKTYSSKLLSENDERSIKGEISSSLKKGNYEYAFLSANFLATFFSEKPEYQYLKSTILMKMEKFDESIEILSDIIKRTPDFEYAYLSIIECLILKKEFHKANELTDDIEEWLKSNRDVLKDPIFFESSLETLKDRLS